MLLVNAKCFRKGNENKATSKRENTFKLQFQKIIHPFKHNIHS